MYGDCGGLSGAGEVRSQVSAISAFLRAGCSQSLGIRPQSSHSVRQTLNNLYF